MTSSAPQQLNQTESPVLGQAIGMYSEREVRPSLRRHFAAAWFHQKPQGAPRQTAVVPDAFADLIWIGGKFLVAGPNRQVSFESVPPGTTVVGLRFQPDALGLWLAVPASEIVGARLALDCFPRNQTQEWTDDIGDATEPDVIVSSMERSLARAAAKLDSPDASSRLILEFMGAARHENGPITRKLTTALGTSERTLRRRCEQLFGYGPKTLDRVLRMQRFLALARHRAASNLSDLAACAGYADQPHLNREARRLSGLSPVTILSQLCGSAHHGVNL